MRNKQLYVCTIVYIADLVHMVRLQSVEYVRVRSTRKDHTIAKAVHTRKVTYQIELVEY